MRFIQRSIELNGPFLLFEAIFLVGGILLIFAGYNLREKNKASGALSVIIGIVIVLLSVYAMISTLSYRINS